jgi:hypothetical protein
LKKKRQAAYAKEERIFSKRPLNMRTLPAELLPFIVEFQPFFSKSDWENAQVLLAGAILAIGKRTVTACLRIMGKSDDPHFQNCHRVLNRAQWSALALSRVALVVLYVAGQDSLGGGGLGLAFFDSALPVGSLLRKARTPSTDLDRASLAARSIGCPLVAGSDSGLCS